MTDCSHEIFSKDVPLLVCDVELDGSLMNSCKRVYSYLLFRTASVHDHR